MRRLALCLVLVLALAGCSAAPGEGSDDAPVQTVQVDAANMRFTPDVIEVPIGTRLVIELTNVDEAQMHDVVLENGTGGAHLAPGESEKVDVGVVTEDIDGWCDISNHRAMGMTLTVTAVEADAD